MIRKSYLSLLLLTVSGAFLQSLCAKPPKHVFTRLDTELLGKRLVEVIDGIRPGMNQDSVLDILQVRNKLNELLYGKANAATRTFSKNYFVNGQGVAVNDLAKLEAEGLDTTSPFWSEFDYALTGYKKELKDFTSTLLEQAKGSAERQLLLIKEWCKKTGRVNSILLHWGSVDEEATLRAANAQQFRQFCIDLKDFLYDLMWNCPKARELFKRDYLPQHEWEKFDASFKQ